MTLPNFLIIGAGKCGTTSLYHYLRQHPDVFMSAVKETNWFAYEGHMPLERQRSMSGSSTESARSGRSGRQSDPPRRAGG